MSDLGDYLCTQVLMILMRSVLFRASELFLRDAVKDCEKEEKIRNTDSSIKIEPTFKSLDTKQQAK